MADVESNFIGDEISQEGIELKDTKDGSPANSEKPFYTVEEVPPLGLSLFNAIQHLLLSIDGVIVLPLVIFSLLCFDDSHDVSYSKSKIMGSYFFLAGLASFLQTTFGVRLPTAQIVSASFFVPLTTLMRSERWKCPTKITNFTDHNISFSSNTSNLYLDNDGEYVGSTEVWQRRMREVQGGIILAGIGQMIIGVTGTVGFALRFIGPLTIAPPLIITSVVLLDLATSSGSIHWGISLSVVAIIILFQYLAKIQVPLPYCSLKDRRVQTTKRPIFAMFPFIFALLFGWLLAHILSIPNTLPTDDRYRSLDARTDQMPAATSNTPWFSIPYPMQWGWPTVSVPTIIAFLAALFIGIVDSLCDYYACAKVVGHPFIPNHAINRGVLVEGFGVVLHGILGTGNATTTFVSSTIGIAITRIHSRRVMQYMSCIYIFLGLFTKFCSVLVAIPMPVLAGQVLIVSGYIFCIAIATANLADLSNMRNMFVVGFSTFFGLMLQNWVAANPTDIDVGSVQGNEIIKSLLGTGMLVSPIVACILDNTLPGTRESRGMTAWQRGEMGIGQEKQDQSIYDLPFKTNWKWTRMVPVCPGFLTQPGNRYDNDIL